MHLRLENLIELKEKRKDLLKAFDGLANTFSNLRQLLRAEEERRYAGDNNELRHSEAEQAVARHPPPLGRPGPIYRKPEAGPIADIIAEEN